MSNVIGYCRISHKSQNIERQIRNIIEIYPTAKIYQEVFTGTTSERQQWQKLIGKYDDETKKWKHSKLKSGDTIIFDSVSRMSRNAIEGVEDYFNLFDRGIELVFLKEPHINTEVYKSSLSNQIELVGDDIDDVLKGINSYLKKLAKKQIEIAFEQSEKEVMDLRQRTKEGLKTAKINGKQIGQVAGTTYETKKSKEMKEKIIKLSKSYNGTLADTDVIELLGLARNTYYKYKREIKKEILT